MALGGAAWCNETRAWRRAMQNTPRPNTELWAVTEPVAGITDNNLGKCITTVICWDPIVRVLSWQ